MTVSPVGVMLSKRTTAYPTTIQTWLNRQIAWADYLEVRDGTGGDRLQFACVPVVAVLSLTIDGQPIEPAASHRAGYNFSRTQLSVRGYRFCRGVQNVVMAYKAGYPAPPPDIAQACIELVALRYRERTRIGEVSKSLGGAETVTYAQTDLGAAIKSLLRQYRLVSPVAGFRPVVTSAGADAAIIAGAL